MKRKMAFVIGDMILFLLNGVLGWFLVILFGLTGSDGKFQDPTVHSLLFAVGFIHLFASILFSLFFWTKERKKHSIRIGRNLCIYNVLMTAFPYCYLALVSCIM